MEKISKIKWIGHNCIFKGFLKSFTTEKNVSQLNPILSKALPENEHTGCKSKCDCRIFANRYGTYLLACGSNFSLVTKLGTSHLKYACTHRDKAKLTLNGFTVIFLVLSRRLFSEIMNTC